MRRLLLAAVLVVLALPANASAETLLPPKNKVYSGVTGGQAVAPFARQVGKHPSVFGFFTRWNGPVEYIYDSVARAESRLMLHIVDWVGTDFYSKFPYFTDLETFYKDFPGKPFVFGEWAMWDGDDPGFVRRFFGWVNGHKRVRMLLYNQGNQADGPFRLTRYPASRRAIKQALKRKRFLGTP